MTTLLDRAEPADTPKAAPAGGGGTWVRSLGRATVTVWRTLNANLTAQIGVWLFVTVALMAIFAPLIATHDPLDQDLFARLTGPTAEHWLGTDGFGRDIWSRIVYGARISLVIGLLAVLIAMVVGTVLGVVAGYFGGWVDQIISQGTDILLAFPSLILGLMVVAVLGPSMENLVAAITLTTIPQFVRVARAPTIALRERDYVQACKALGYSPVRTMGIHILPNILPEVLVMASLWLATAIRVEASLAFIGLGVKPPTPTWGGMIREGFENVLTSPWLAVWPSIAILVVVFALNMIGDGLRDAVDPRMKGGH
ncbi:MAG: ABC transporter permease [Caenispirillum sp.]|nr:ABC transporter permease [Caenispirillum sp.]